MSDSQPQKVATPPYFENELEKQINQLSIDILDMIKKKDITLANFAVFDQEILDNGTQSKLSEYIIDRLKHSLIMRGVPVVEKIKISHLQALVNRNPLKPPKRCEKRDYPEVILLISIQDYGEMHDSLYLSINARRAESNSIILSSEKKITKNTFINSLLNSRVTNNTIAGSQFNPFRDMNQCADYLASELFCGYTELVEEWSNDAVDYVVKEKINPDEISFAIISSDSLDKESEYLIAKLKHFFTSEYQIINMIDIQDYIHIDKQLEFYENNDFKLDFTSSNSERFQVPNLLLIVESRVVKQGVKEVMVRAAFINNVESSFGRGEVSGIYLSGFSAFAFLQPRSSDKIKIHLTFNNDPGADAAYEIIRGELVNEGYQVVKNENDADVIIKMDLKTQECFADLDSPCYDCFIRKLELSNNKGLLKSLPIQNWYGRDNYVGHSYPSYDEERARRSSVSNLWARVKNDIYMILSDIN